MKLKVLVIPQSIYGVNLRNKLGKAWRDYRLKILKQYQFKCVYCHFYSPSNHAHENWTICHNTRTSTLKEVVCVCRRCHMCIHILFALHLHKQGKLNLETIIQHFCKVNNCNRDAWHDAVKNAQAEQQMCKDYVYWVGF